MIKKDLSRRLLSDLVVFTKYARYRPDLGRRENWREIVDRYVAMMIRKYVGEEAYQNFKENKVIKVTRGSLGERIILNSQYLYDMKVLPSMRAAQFSGPAIEKNHSRIYNCSYAPITSYHSFSELCFLLLGGIGCGYSVQKHHVDQLPPIKKPIKSRKFLIGDSIEGWSDAVKALLKAYLGVTNYKPRFDYSDIRQKGETLVTAGGKAPGPDPLRICLTKIEALLNSLEDGEKLSPINCHDICCHIADAVLAGGIRRAALICLFSPDDKDMLTCKFGQWWELNPQRGRANNSVVLNPDDITKEEFDTLFQAIIDSNSGEPGFYFSKNSDYGTNPCAEISLAPYTFCNLTEVNAGNIESEEDFRERVRVASFFGTLQAGFTDFHYLRQIWKHNTEEDALVGVGITGICNGIILDYNLKEAAEVAKRENELISKEIGINSAARVTTIKPAGTTSTVLSVSSGIHAWHSKYYIRNMQCKVGDDLFNYFVNNHPDLIKVMDYDPNSAVIGCPISAPEEAILREDESAIDLLERIELFNLLWVRIGHRRGPNFNNVSATVSVKPEEWAEVREWMWKNRSFYHGISLLPYDGGTYRDAPFQECTEEEYMKKLELMKEVDITNIKEAEDNTELSTELACSGQDCSLVY